MPMMPDASTLNERNSLISKLVVFVNSSHEEKNIERRNIVIIVCQVYPHVTLHGHRIVKLK